MANSGMLIISLDFELHWGVFESVKANSPYIKNLLKTPEAINRMLEVFEKRKISVTWAIVGFLFAESIEMRKYYEPSIKPIFKNAESNPYLLQTGPDESVDPLHFAPSIIKRIQCVPGQEIATHTFSHFFCGRIGSSINAFLSDLESAKKIAEKYGINIRSIVFPRNQLINEFIDLLPKNGINIFRGTEKGWMYPGIKSFNENNLTMLRQKINKIGRILDTYLPLTGSNTRSINELMTKQGQPLNIPASRFVRFYDPRLKKLEWLKFQRIRNQIKHAATKREMVHLWWHPHNFGSYTDENIKFLEKILDYFDYCRSEYNMKSMTMSEYFNLIESSRPGVTEIPMMDPD